MFISWRQLFLEPCGQIEIARQWVTHQEVIQNWLIVSLQQIFYHISLIFRLHFFFFLPNLCDRDNSSRIRLRILILLVDDFKRGFVVIKHFWKRRMVDGIVMFIRSPHIIANAFTIVLVPKRIAPLMLQQRLHSMTHQLKTNVTWKVHQKQLKDLVQFSFWVFVNKFGNCFDFGD